MAGVIDPDYQGKFGLLHNGGKEEYIWNTRDHLGCLLVCHAASSDFQIIASEPGQL